jgi:hypothetical protein
VGLTRFDGHRLSGVRLRKVSRAAFGAHRSGPSRRDFTADAGQLNARCVDIT